jgi:hypothetical protein
LSVLTPREKNRRARASPFLSSTSHREQTTKSVANASGVPILPKVRIGHAAISKALKSGLCVQNRTTVPIPKRAIAEISVIDFWIGRIVLKAEIAIR